MTSIHTLIIEVVYSTAEWRPGRKRSRVSPSRRETPCAEFTRDTTFQSRVRGALGRGILRGGRSRSQRMPPVLHAKGGGRVGGGISLSPRGTRRSFRFAGKRTGHVSPPFRQRPDRQRTAILLLFISNPTRRHRYLQTVLSVLL